MNAWIPPVYPVRRLAKLIFFGGWGGSPMKEVKVYGSIREVADDMLAGTRTVRMRLGGATGNGTRCNYGIVIESCSN